MSRPPKNPLHYLGQVAKRQLTLANELSTSLKNRMETKKKVAADWIPDEDWRRDFASVTTTLQHAGNSLARAIEGNKKNLGGLTEEQLEAQFNAEIINAAGTLTDEQWQRMCEARAKRGQS